MSIDVKQPSILDAMSKPAAAKKSTATKLATSSETEDSAPSKKPTAVRKRKGALSSDDSGSDSEGGNLMARLKGRATAAEKVRLRHARLHWAFY